MTEPVRVLCADPPWPFLDKLPGGGRGAVKKYKLMTLSRIQKYPLPEMADDSVLALWRVSSMQAEALDVIKAWGFTLKSEVVWNKRRRCGTCKGIGRVQAGVSVNHTFAVKDCEACGGVGHRAHFGMGRQVRMAHEVCLLATRGKNIRRDETSARNVPSTFEAMTGEHSDKPAAFFRILERLYAGPYHELFARGQREGWHCEGDEAWASVQL